MDNILEGQCKMDILSKELGQVHEALQEVLLTQSQHQEELQCIVEAGGDLQKDLHTIVVHLRIYLGINVLGEEPNEQKVTARKGVGPRKGKCSKEKRWW